MGAANKEVLTGVVKFFSTQKGYGFIKDDLSENEYFVHITGVKMKTSLKKNDLVIFQLEDAKRGVKAVNVVCR